MRIAYGSLLPLLFYATTQYAMYAVFFNGSEIYCNILCMWLACSVCGLNVECSEA